MTQPLRLGLIGVDSPHSVQFTRLLGDGIGSRVPGGAVRTAWQSPTSADFPPSRDRNDALAREVAGLGVELLPSPDAVAEASDALLLVSSDSRTRPEHFTLVARHGKPVYVDTRFAPDPASARAMVRLGEESGCLVLAGSPKRFTPQFRDAVAAGADAVSITGPLPTQPGHPGLAWYGVHLVDLAVAALGPGCVRVEPHDGRLRLIWNDGRTADLGGPAEWGPQTRGEVRRGDDVSSFEITADEDMLTGLLDSVLSACRSGTPNVPPAQILQTVDIVAAGTTALASGSPVDLA